MILAQMKILSGFYELIMGCLGVLVLIGALLLIIQALTGRLDK